MKYTTDFTTINEDIRNKIAKRVEELGCDTVLVCRFNNHPDEYDKLFMVIGKYKTPHKYFDGQYAVWTATMFDGKESLCHGHYHVDFKTALEIVGERITDFNQREEN
jgi:hypothetical protein